MKLVYIDESGKGFVNDPQQDYFIYGGIAVEKENVETVLNIYKTHFKKAKEKVKKSYEENLKTTMSEEDYSNFMRELSEKFEIHSVEVFNPTREKVRKGVLKKANPWKHISPVELSKMIEDIMVEIFPYIERIVMFKTDKDKFLDFCGEKSFEKTNEKADELIIECVLDTFNEMGSSTDSHVTLVTDMLSSDTRELFVKKINEKTANLHKLWAEPIIVESSKNAFTQIVDILTYLYHLDVSGKIEKEQYKKIKSVYKQQIKDKIERVELIDYLKEKY